MRPFSVGGGEVGGGYSGWTAWLLAAQSKLTHLMSGELHAIPHDAGAFWTLCAIGFVYGVAHAAGPGHGKAVIASYMMANERALRRGLVLAFFAALLQGIVAIAIVAIGAALLQTTAARMNALADGLATASYLGLAAIGAWLTIRKGAALIEAVRAFALRRELVAGSLLFAGAPWGAGNVGLARTGGEAACGHVHAPDPRTLGDGFSWRPALATVVAAGSRPCSGALLLLVFALSQGLFLAGVAATLTMALGVALATGGLASLAVFAKRLALRFAAGEDSRAALIARGCEFIAALLVLVFGLALLFAARGAG